MLEIPKGTVIEEISAEDFNRNQLKIFKSKFKDLRQLSKRVTFALQYGGTENTLEKNCGFSHKEASEIVANYKKLYSVSEKEKADHIKQAGIDGYVLGAFGLKVRTPVLQQTILGIRATPKEAEAEARTASNARFQSYGLLNSRAGMAFNQKVRASKYALDIKPVAQIHDAQYFLVKDDADVLLWMNRHLVEETSWQEDPAISHPEVHLGGEVSIFYPDWAHECVIPNDVNSYTQLSTVINDYLKELKK